MACVAALFVEAIIQGTSDHLHKPHSLFNEVYFERKAKAATEQGKVCSGVFEKVYNLCLCR